MLDGFPVGYNSTAVQGNYLEAINLSFNGEWDETALLLVLLVKTVLVCVVGGGNMAKTQMPHQIYIK